jgi:hypothetical protein
VGVKRQDNRFRVQGLGSGFMTFGVVQKGVKNGCGDLCKRVVERRN